jgi:hypothetical protein
MSWDVSVPMTFDFALLGYGALLALLLIAILAVGFRLARLRR